MSSILIFSCKSELGTKVDIIWYWFLWQPLQCSLSFFFFSGAEVTVVKVLYILAHFFCVYLRRMKFFSSIISYNYIIACCKSIDWNFVSPFKCCMFSWFRILKNWKYNDSHWIFYRTDDSNIRIYFVVKFASNIVIQQRYRCW